MLRVLLSRKTQFLAFSPLKYFGVTCKEVEFFIKYREKPEEPVRKLKGDIGSVLGKVLESNKVPLAFECMLSCECATCAVSFETEKDFTEISEVQPMDTEEKVTMKSNNVPEGCRLSCQMKICKEMDKKIFLI